MAHPPLAPAEVHVWCADLSDPLADERVALACDEERARAARMATGASDPQLWLRSRGILRELLGAYLDLDPRTLRLRTTARGKPTLFRPRTRALRFNLSHSRSLALFAFAYEFEVGVDLEVHRRARSGTRDWSRLAMHAFGAVAAQHLRALPECEQEREFLRLWTLAEAAAKCVGDGIPAREPLAPRSAAQAPWSSELRGWRCVAAALAASRPPSAVLCRDWNAAVR